MAAICGKDADIKVGANTVGLGKSWTLNMNLDVLDTTNFGSSGWRENLGCLRGWSGTMEALWDMSDAAQTALQDAVIGTVAKVYLQLYTNDTNYYSGSAYIANVNPGAAVEDLVTVSFDFTGDGALSYT